MQDVQISEIILFSLSFSLLATATRVFCWSETQSFSLLLLAWLSSSLISVNIFSHLVNLEAWRHKEDFSTPPTGNTPNVPPIPIIRVCGLISRDSNPAPIFEPEIAFVWYEAIFATVGGRQRQGRTRRPGGNHLKHLQTQLTNPEFCEAAVCLIVNFHCSSIPLRTEPCKHVA